MDKLTALVSSDIWVRWRRGHGYRSYVDLLGRDETVLADGRIVDVGSPLVTDDSSSKLGMVAGAVLGQLRDRWTRGVNWDFRAPERGENLFVVRTRTSRDAPNVFTVAAGDDTVIGTVSAQQQGHRRTRELRPASGAVCSYVPVTKLLGTAGESSRATIVDGALVLATVFHDVDPDAVLEVVPRSGMISPHDFGVAFGSGADIATRVLALVAAILDTKAHEIPVDYSTPGGNGRNPTPHAAPGTDPRSARKEERAQAKVNQANDRLEQMQDKARRVGKGELAERLEKHRRKN